jgi:hypothetical protein
MNPSASGWIDKFGSLDAKNKYGYLNFESLYEDLKATGFIYGFNLYSPDFIETEHKLHDDEKAKLNLLNALYQTYALEKGSQDFERFIEVVFQFYQELDVGKVSFLQKIISGTKTSAQLEKLLDSRIHIADNVFSKTFTSLVTNGLLCIDVLTFRRFLSESRDILGFAQELEYATIGLALQSLEAKEPHKKDKKLAHILEASLSFVDHTPTYSETQTGINLERFGKSEKTYLLDMACLTVWEDQALKYAETARIHTIGRELGFGKETTRDSLFWVGKFFAEHKEDIPHYKDHNLATQFYDNMSKMVNRLIKRNSKRLLKELSESKELLYLLSQSTLRDLDTEEKKKVQKQLLDIFKSIPSLAIFMLPGGAVLLPMFIKLIPKLLPSAFDDNRIEDD